MRLTISTITLPLLVALACAATATAAGRKKGKNGKNSKRLGAKSKKAAKVSNLAKQSIAATQAAISSAAGARNDTVVDEDACVDTHKKGTAWCEAKNEEKEAQLKRWCRGKWARKKCAKVGGSRSGGVAGVRGRLTPRLA